MKYKKVNQLSHQNNKMSKINKMYKIKFQTFIIIKSKKISKMRKNNIKITKSSLSNLSNQKINKKLILLQKLMSQIKIK